VAQQRAARHSQLMGDLGGHDLGVHVQCAVPVHQVLERFEEAVATLGRRLQVHVQAVYSTGAPDKLEQELMALRTPAPDRAPPGYAFWSPSAIQGFADCGGFELPVGPVVLIGGSTMRCWEEVAPPAWRRAFRHDAETPLEWSLRFLERDSAVANGDG